MDFRFNTLVEIYRHAVASYGPNPLFGVKKGGQWHWMTYEAFGEAVDRIRGGLRALGVEKGDRVAMIANNRPEWAIAAYATYGLGAAFVPMYEAQKTSDWRYIIGDCGAKVVFVADARIRDEVLSFKDELATLEHVVVIDGGAAEGAMTWDELLKKGEESPAEMVEVTPDDLAGLIYTSGTTGNPKGVRLSHGNFARNVSAMQQVFPIDDTERSLSFLPWAHSFGQSVELHALVSVGASMGIAESVPKIIENLAEVRPTLLYSVPRIFNKIYDGLNKKMAEEGGLKKKLFDAAIANAARRRELADRGERSFLVELKHKIFDKLVFSKVRERFGGRLKYAFSGGAAISKEVAEFIDSLGIMVYEGYGLTETSPVATANWPGSRKIGSVGRPIPGVDVKIDREVTGHETDGEIVVYGHCVMQGYHNLPEENAKVFTEDGGFRTGDMGRLDEDGFLYITGRIKEQYKLENGKYVVPSPLEEKLKLEPVIANVMIYGDNKPFNVAVIVPDMEVLKGWAAGQGIDTSDPQKLLQDERVRAYVKERLEARQADFGGYQKVKKFVLVAEDFSTENGMLTPTLKLKRRAVLQRYGKDVESLYADAA